VSEFPNPVITECQVKERDQFDGWIDKNISILESSTIVFDEICREFYIRLVGDKGWAANGLDPSSRVTSRQFSSCE
jgi:hypothetical protein